MTGCNVTSSSFSGICRTCSRLRPGEREAVEHEVARASAGPRIDGQGGERCSWRATSSRATGRVVSDEEDVVERRLAAVDVDRVDAGRVERAYDLDQSRARPGRDRDLPLVGILARARPRRTARASRPRSRRSPASLDGDDDALAADARLELGRRAGRRDAPVVEQHDLVGEAVGLLEVLRRQHERGALADEVARAAPTGRCGSADRGRSSARRGTAPAARRRGSRRGRGAGACRPRRCARAGRRASSSRSCASSSSVAPAHDRARQVVEAPDELEVGARRQQAVDGRALAGRGRCARAPGRARDTGSKPATSALPDVGSASVVRMRIAVVLPAPLWPSRPSTLPAGAWKLTSSSASDVAVALAETVGVDADPDSIRTLYVIVVRHTTNLAVHCTNVKEHRRADLGAPRARRAPAAPHARADRGRRARDRRQRGHRGRLDASRRPGARRGHDDALPLRAHQGRAARPDGRRDHGRGAGARRTSSPPTGARR